MFSILRSNTFDSIEPYPAVSKRPATFTCAISLTLNAALAIAATPPCSLNWLRRNSFTHTSPLTSRLLLLRTPIMMACTSSSVGLPKTVILFSNFSGSYTTYGMVLPTLVLPARLALLRAIFASVNALNGKSNVFSLSHTFSRSSALSSL